LAAMMRFVYPDVVDIAYASSALPLYAQKLDEYAYFDKIDVVEAKFVWVCRGGQAVVWYARLSDGRKSAQRVATNGHCVETLPAITDIEIFATPCP
jgi:hypothetical protein